VWPAEPQRSSAVFIAPGQSWLATAGKAGAAQAFAGEPFETLATRLAGGDALRVVVSNHYLRTTPLPWSHSLTDAAGSAAYLGARWRQAFGDTGTDWSLTLEPGAFENAATLLALPRALAQTLAASSAGTRLVQPLISAAFAHCASKLPADCLFATVEPGCLALAVVKSGRITTLSRHRIADNWSHAVTLVRRRLLLQQAELAPLPLHVLTFVEGAADTGGNDFLLVPGLSASASVNALLIASGLKPGSGFNLLPARSRRSQAERWLLGAAAAVFLLALGSWLHTGHSEAQAKSDPAPAPLAPTLDAKQRQQLAREVASANKAIGALNLPADALLVALSPQQLKEVALLNIDISSEGKAQVVAAAKSIAGMEAYLHLLEQRHDLAAVNLLHHEAGANGDWPYHFTLEAQWQRP
jgi:hypothetical protein